MKRFHYICFSTYNLPYRRTSEVMYLEWSSPEYEIASMHACTFDPSSPLTPLSCMAAPICTSLDFPLLTRLASGTTFCLIHPSDLRSLFWTLSILTTHVWSWSALLTTLLTHIWLLCMTSSALSWLHSCLFICLVLCVWLWSRLHHFSFALPTWPAVCHRYYPPLAATLDLLNQ